MATRLEIAKNKLGRLEKELYQAQDAASAHLALANGQPMNDKRNGPAFFKRQDKLEDKIFRIMDEIKKQKERIEHLEDIESYKAEGLNRNGIGLKLTIDNIPRIKEEIEKYEKGKISYTAATIRKYKKRVAELEAAAAQIENTEISQKAQELIDSGKVTQWKKHPTVYFVKGYRKIAVILDTDGRFKLSARYYPHDDKIKQEILELIS